MVNHIQHWAEAIKSGDLQRAERVVEELEDYPRLYRHVASLHECAKVVLDAVREKEGKSLEAHRILRTHNFVYGVKEFLRKKMKEAMSARRQADPAPVKKVLPSPVPTGTERLPKTSVWHDNEATLSFDAALQLIPPRARTLVFALRKGGNRDYSFADCKERMGTSSERLRFLVHDARPFLEELGIGTITPLSGYGYRFELQTREDLSFKIFEVLRLFKSHERDFAVRLSCTPDTIIEKKSMQRTLALSDKNFGTAMTAIRTLLRETKTQFGVLNESSKHMQLTTRAPVPLEQLVSLTVQESILWQYISQKPEQLVTIASLRAHLNASWPSGSFANAQVLPCLRSVIQKVEEAKIISVPRKNAYMYTNNPLIPGGIIKNLTLDEYLPLKIASARPDARISADAFFDDCVAERGARGFRADPKGIRESLRTLEAKLLAADFHQFVIRRRNQFLEYVTFLSKAPAALPPNAQKEEQQGSSLRDRPDRTFLAAAKARFQQMCLQACVTPELNDTKTDIVGLLLEAGAEGIPTAALLTKTRLQSLNQPIAELNKGLLAQLGMRITTSEDIWRLEEGTRWAPRDQNGNGSGITPVRSRGSIHPSPSFS